MLRARPRRRARLLLPTLAILGLTPSHVGAAPA